MEAMIKRIIDMDKKAREITESAQKEKLTSEKEIAEKAKSMREDYLGRARRRIQINDETERRLAENSWKDRELFYESQRKKLEETFSARREELTEAIVENVLAQ